MKGERGIIPIFIAHMGCGHACIFCNQHAITGDTRHLPPEAIKTEIETCLKTMRQPIKELAFYGGSFTGLDMGLQRQYLQIAAHYKRTGTISRIRLSTRPDYIDDARLSLLKEYGVDLIELGCQSFDDCVLDRSRRGHDQAAIYAAIEAIKRHGLSFGIQLMYGLPGDTRARFLDSVDRSIALRPECVRIYPTLVIRGTALAHLDGYKAPTLEQATQVTAEAIRRFMRSGIEVIRVGLQKTDLIDFDAEVKDGPLHPAFGAWVMSFLFFEAMLPALKRCARSDFYQIRVNPSMASYVTGQGRVNVKRFEAALGRPVKFKIQPDVSVEKNVVWVADGHSASFSVDIINTEV